MYSKRSSSPEYATTRPSSAILIAAPSCLNRPRGVCLIGFACGSCGSISTTQPKRFGSFGSRVTSQRLSNRSHLRVLAAPEKP